jgi:hypothetical protein
MEWLGAGVAVFVVEGFQFLLKFECTLKPAWSTLITGAPLSVAAGLLTAIVLRRASGRPRFPPWAWIVVVLLALVGVPLYLLGHICG